MPASVGRCKVCVFTKVCEWAEEWQHLPDSCFSQWHWPKLLKNEQGWERQQRNFSSCASKMYFLRGWGLKQRVAECGALMLSGSNVCLLQGALSPGSIHNTFFFKWWWKFALVFCLWNLGELLSLLTSWRGMLIPLHNLGSETNYKPPKEVVMAWPVTCLPASIFHNVASCIKTA